MPRQKAKSRTRPYHNGQGRAASNKTLAAAVREMARGIELERIHGEAYWSGEYRRLGSRGRS